jgi:hypothetical protein
VGRGSVRRRAARAGALLWAALALACNAEAELPAPETAVEEEEEEAAPARPGSPNARHDVVESLQADRAAPRHPSDGGGRAWLDWDGDPPALEAGGVGRFPIVYEAGPLGIAEGGGLYLQVPPFWGWSHPQTHEPLAPGYTEVSTTADGVTLEVVAVDQQLLRIGIGGRALDAGERIAIVYGAGPAQARVDRYAERGSRLWLAVDGDGDGVRALVPDSPAVDVGAGPPARLLLHLPSVARPGETVFVVAAVLDAVANAGIEVEGELVIEAHEGVESEPRAVFTRGDAGVLRVPVVLHDTGVVRLRASGPFGLVAESNPLVVSEQATAIRWGDLHGHSNLSDGTGTPDDYYRYAREVAALDVAALTDHDHWGMPFLDDSPELWEGIVAATARHHEPGRFVTLLGYEWTSWIYGHRHVLHFTDRAEVRSSLDPETDTPGKLWAALAGQEALTIAHHSAGNPVATDWSIAPDPLFEPVTEIASVHGSSEGPGTPAPVRGMIPGNAVIDALARGYRLGFVGSGDSHDGHPGLAHLAAGSGGLAALLTEAVSREGVLEALRARRTYATNGPRIVLFATLDGAPMGSALPAGEDQKLRVGVVATAPLRAVELVADGHVVEHLAGEGRRELAFETEIGSTPPGGVLYVRVLQEDGGAAWSSPFFFE